MNNLLILFVSILELVIRCKRKALKYSIYNMSTMRTFIKCIGVEISYYYYILTKCPFLDLVNLTRTHLAVYFFCISCPFRGL